MARGSAPAKARLAALYESGRGEAEDASKAIGLFETAAVEGNAFAQLRIGKKYATGEGVEQDYVRAHKWVNLAAIGGNAEAIKLRDTFSKLMTREQIAQAQKLAREWIVESRAKK